MHSYKSIIPAALIILCNFLQAQIKIEASPGEVFIVPELGTILVLKGDKVAVEAKMPSEAIPQSYRDKDIKEKDIIMMVNGKKISGTVEIEDIYEAAATGEEIKFGIKRGDELLIVSFEKMDKESMPRRRMLKVTAGDDGVVSKKIINEDGSEQIIEGDSLEIDGKKMHFKDIKDKGKVRIKVKEDGPDGY